MLYLNAKNIEGWKEEMDAVSMYGFAPLLLLDVYVYIFILFFDCQKEKRKKKGMQYLRLEWLSENSQCLVFYYDFIMTI